MYTSRSGREFAGDCGQCGSHGDYQCDSPGHSGKAAGSLWLSSAGLCSDSPGIRSHNLDLGMDPGQKIKQDDADGSIEAHRGSSAKTQEKFPDPCRCFWNGGRAGRQCLKGTAKVLKDSFFISDTVASGFYADAVFLYTFSYQYERNLF